jgi:hypothetical protein
MEWFPQHEESVAATDQRPLDSRAVLRGLSGGSLRLRVRAGCSRASEPAKGPVSPLRGNSWWRLARSVGKIKPSWHTPSTIGHGRSTRTPARGTRRRGQIQGSIHPASARIAQDQRISTGLLQTSHFAQLELPSGPARRVGELLKKPVVPADPTPFHVPSRWGARELVRMTGSVSGSG